MKKHQWKFVALTQGFKPKVVDTFEEAWRDMYAWVKKMMDEEQLSYQVLETAIWLETGAHPLPVMFNAARDRACREGIMDKIKAEEKKEK